MPRGRRPKSYARRPPRREPYDVVLIVCEGAKSEPAYFNGLRAAHRLSSANIHVMSARGSDPMSIVAFAENEMATNEYDKAFCVFDRNGHTNYDAALARIARSPLGRTGKLKAITSWPCFEIWLLLHFRYSTGPFNRAGSESSCDRAIKELLTFLPEYTKGRQTIFDELASQMPTAITNAKRLRTHNSRSSSTNPSTRIHTLVGYLIKIKRSVE
jgi:hypothetical protein